MTATTVPSNGTNNGEASTAIATRAPAAASLGSRGIIMTSFDDLARFSLMVEKSGFAPKGMGTAAIGVAIQMGFEVGLSPMQALQSTAVINGRPTIYGDAAKALVEASGLLEKYDQWYELDGKRLQTADGYSRTPTAAELKNGSVTCFVLSKRIKREPLVTSFSVEDAKAAGLWGKQGPWSQFPARMLMFRARGFNLRDNFGDVLKGLRTVEEARDEIIEIDQPQVADEAPKTGVAGLADKLRHRGEVPEFTGNTFEEPKADASNAKAEEPTPEKPKGRGKAKAAEQQADAPVQPVTDAKLAEGEITPEEMAKWAEKDAANN